MNNSNDLRHRNSSSSQRQFHDAKSDTVGGKSLWQHRSELGNSIYDVEETLEERTSKADARVNIWFGLDKFDCV